MLPYPTQ